MIKIQIKTIFGGVIFESEKENNTVSEAIKDYIAQELEEGNSYANLSYAYLSDADLDKRYISISCLGSSKRMTTYCFEDDFIWCGCFTGNLKEFENEVNKTHKDNEQYLKEYLGFINYIKGLI
jgi:hypothetical protein